MKTVILKKQYLSFQSGTELSFMDDVMVDRLINEGIAELKEKGLEASPKDKMIRSSKNKVIKCK